MRTPYFFRHACPVFAHGVARLIAFSAAAFAACLTPEALAQARQITPATITVSAGDPITPVQFSVTGGSSNTKWAPVFELPKGLQLSISGVLSGTPDRPGVWGPGYKLPARISTTTPDFGQNITINIQPNAPTITSPANRSNLGNAYLNRPFGPVEIEATGGVAPYTWTASISGTGGNVTITPTGPTTARLTANFSSPGALPPANYTVSVAANGSNARPQSSAPVNYTISLLRNPPAIASPPSGTRLGNATVGQPYGPVSIQASGGFAPYKNWSVLSVTISPPPRSGTANSTASIEPVPGTGNATAHLTGNFTSVGNATVKVRVQGDNGESSAVSTYTIPVLPAPPPAPPVIAPPGGALPDATVGVVYGPVPFSASGGRPPFKNWTANLTNLPASNKSNVSIAASGSGNGNAAASLSGAFTEPGNYTLRITVTDSNNRRASGNFTINATRIPPIRVSLPKQALLPPGSAGVDYSQSFAVSGGAGGPYSLKFSDTQGEPPPGLEITPASSDGTFTLSGVPTKPGRFLFWLEPADSRPVKGALRGFDITINPNPVVVRPATLPVAVLGVPYPAFGFHATGGRTPYTWTSTPTPPAAGLSLNSTTGALSGTPVRVEGTTYPLTVPFQVRALDQIGQSGTGNFSLLLVERLAISGPKVVSGYQGARYTANESFTATGGRKPYAFSWNATSGNKSVSSLTGLSLNASQGRISGNFTGNPGTYPVLARVTDNSTQQDTIPTAIRILKRPTLSIVTPSNLGTVDTTVTNSLRLRANPRTPAVGGNYTWSLVGPVVKTPSTANVTITVSPLGILSYRAPSRCSANFTVRVQDRIGSFATKNFTVSFRNPRDLYIQTRWLPTGYIGYPYSAIIHTKNGKDPISWSVIAGSLGPEFELVPQNSGRQVIVRWKGALPPSTSISKTFTLRAIDSSPIKQVDECEYVLDVIPVPPPPPPPPPPAPKPKLFDRIQSNLPFGKILAVDDWNGDGLNDVFLRSRNPESGEDQSALYTNRGRFSFLSDDAFPVEARSAVKLFVEDFDNDGLSDLLSLDAQLRASLHINSGEGSFETTELAGLFAGDLATIDPENDLSCSDIDADGDIDLIAAVRNSSGGHVVALWNRADDEGDFPSLFSGKSYLIKSTAPYPKFSVVSLDSNPKPDLLVLLSAENSSSNAPAVLYLNSGNASADYANSNNATSCIAFPTATQTAIIGSPDGSFVSADIDSDGDMDLIAPASLNENSSTLDAPRFFLNQGNNTFTGGNAPILDAALQHRGLAAFDADLDGAIDLVWTEVSGMGALYPRLWKNSWAANSAFTDITQLPDTGLAAVPASEIEMVSTGFSADLDGDRDPDFLFTASSAEGGLESDPASFAVFRNNSESRGARWINTQLIGVFSPSRGTGAKVVLQRDGDIVDGNGTLVTAKPKFAQLIGPDTGNRAKNSLIFGLAGKGSADRVSVEWTSGLSTSVANALANPFYWPPHRPPVYRFLRLPETDALPPQRPIRQGRVIPWGAAPAGSQTAFTANLTDSVAISAGGTHSLSLAANGIVKAWGGNASGQTALPPKLVDIVQISAGGSHNLALRSNGRITAWGDNQFGQSTVPPPLRYAKYIAAGRDFSLAIDGLSNVVAWGNNSTGQCAPPPDLGPVNAVAGGGEHALALLADGTLAAWGSNSAGQLDVPTGGGTKFIQIAAGANHSLALTENGRVVAWGSNGAGQSTVPGEALQNISQISASGNQSLALRSDGAIIAWGEGYQNAHLKPVASNVVAISAGSAHALALKALSSGYDPSDFVDVRGGRFPDNDSLPEDAPLYLFPDQQVNSFRIGKYEVTRGEWIEVARWAIYNGYQYFTEGAGGQGQYSHPAYDLSWFDAIAWCNAKSEINGLTPAYKLNGQTYKGSGASDPSQIQLIAGATGFRLPTEIQWEWAARGGNLTKNFLFSGSNNLDEVAIYEGNSVNASPRLEGSRGAFPVGSKLPNELGIHDMSGNVWEHCFSIAEVTSEDEITGNLTTSNGTISRGGSWLNSEVSCGFTDQAVQSQIPGFAINTTGFRLALLAEPEIVMPSNAVEIQPTGSPQTYEFVVRDPGTTNSPWGSYRWTIEGNLPPGIAHSGFLNGQSLVLSGTPNSPGWYDIILQVETDGYIVRKPVTLKFTPSGNETEEMILVEGGTLPESSELAGQQVATFLIGKYEVTWEQWQGVRTWAVANGYPDLEGVGAGSAGNHPVRDVSWYDVVKWSNAKSEMEGLEPVYSVNGTVYRTGQFGHGSGVVAANSAANGYRLPKEAEWEWAARGGLHSQSYTYSGSNNLNVVAWHKATGIATGDDDGTKIVGTKAPNELLIHDMSGNVWELCWDVYDSDPRRRILRGGGWFGEVIDCAVAHRFGGFADDNGHQEGFIGFRLARNSSP